MVDSPQDHRPPARKVTATNRAKAAAAADAEQESGVKVTLDGVDYVVRQGDLNGRLTRELRQQTGCSFQKLITELDTDPDIDSVAALVWLARRIEGEAVTYDEVAEEVGYDADIDVNTVSQEDAGEPDPEG